MKRKVEYRQGAEALKESIVYLLAGKPNTIFMALKIL